jgi:hypothetical protein
MTRNYPTPEIPEEQILPLAQMVAQTSWLPHPETVREFGGAVFPALRARTGKPRLSLFLENGEPAGMYDDNATPAWALFWSHGIIKGTRPPGWTVAHVWPETDCIHSYTHLANLALVPECFGTLTDKTGPLTDFLKWHAWVVYEWKPARYAPPGRPAGYETVTWRYFGHAADPKALVRQMVTESDNQRTRILRPIMERNGML